MALTNASTQFAMGLGLPIPPPVMAKKIYQPYLSNVVQKYLFTVTVSTQCLCTPKMIVLTKKFGKFLDYLLFQR